MSMASPLPIGQPTPSWRHAPRRWSTAAQAAVALAVIAVAYHHSLAELLGYLSADTPLAYVGLVPLLAVGLALVKARPRPGELRLPDRQFDWIVGLPLMALALLVAVVLPDRLSYSFWTNRLDLLGLPLFAAGVVALLFGSRVLYRIRLPIVFLILAWPLPYEQGMDHLLSFSTRVALWGVEAGLPLVGGAQVVADSIYRVGEGSRQFTVNIAPTCAGANSAVGFLLVGGAVAAVVNAPRLKKLAWLLLGVALMLALNIGRLLMLFWAGDRYGEDVMMNSLHPYAGLALFIVGCLVMVALLPRFGMGARTAAGPPAAGAAGSSDGTAEYPTAPVRLRRGSKPALAVVLALASVLAIQNADLVRFDAFGPLKASTASTMSALDGSVTVPGWTGVKYLEVDWAKQYFGKSSSWWRYVYETPTTNPSTPGRSMFVDVVNVADVNKFSDYGLEACYRFHGYQIVRSDRVDVGAAGPGQRVTYLNPKTKQAWNVVAWVSPVATSDGRRFERIALLGAVDGGDDDWRRRSDDATATMTSFARSFTAAAAAGSRPRLASAPTVTGS